VLLKEPNVLYLQPPITVCGNIHGQIFDLSLLFELGGELPGTKYLFLGDYVNTGHYCVEVISLLVLLKIKYPEHIFLLRGENESRLNTKLYGYQQEVKNKYPNSTFWDTSVELFEALPIAAIIDSPIQNNRIFCVHGGLSPRLETIDDIQKITRNTEIPYEGLYYDLLWSDPEEVTVRSTSAFSRSPYNPGGWMYGKNAVDNFLTNNSMGLVARAHQLEPNGYRYMFDEKLVTVWSAPNFRKRSNKAAIMKVDNDGNREFKVFDAAPQKGEDVDKG